MTKAKANTKAQDAKLTKGNNVPDVHQDAFEDVKKEEKNSDVVDTDNIEWLESADFMEYVNPKDKNMVSSKYDHEREPRVQAGLLKIKELFPDINPLIILLAKWWENKSARASIKNAIDKEAQENGTDPVVYLQSVLRAPVDELKDMQSAIERTAYAITYFKPREAAASKKTKPMTIGKDMYNVPIIKLEELRKEFGDDKEKFIEEVLKIAIKVEVEEL